MASLELANCEHMRLPEIPENGNYFGAFSDISTGYATLINCYQHLAKASNQSVVGYVATSAISESLELSKTFTKNEVKLVLSLCFAWSLLRYLTAKVVFPAYTQSLNGMSKVMKTKLNESLWKITAYSILWLTSFYVTFYRGHDFYQNTSLLFTNDRNDIFDIKLCYALEASFYFHALFATLFLDAKRKDDVAMIIHHVVTLGLICFSYKINMMTIGVLIFMLDDISDILLELARVFKYITLSDQYKGSTTLSNLSDTCAALFAILWVVNRLYLHVTKVWRAAAYGAFVSAPWILPYKMSFALNVMMTLLYVLYCYWFMFILNFIYRIIVEKDAKDPTDDED